MTLQHTVKATVRKGEKYYVAECLEIAVVTQGKTLDETLANLQEAVALHLEGEDLGHLWSGAEPHHSGNYGAGGQARLLMPDYHAVESPPC